ncbi:MAG: dihydroorotase [Flavobacterium sp.]
MNLLIKNVKIIDQNSDFHLQTLDVLIENGKYIKIEKNIERNDIQIIESDNLYLSNGWIDSSCSLGFPGYEDRETIANGLQTAAKSGFTHIMITPNTNPVADHVSITQNIINQSFNQLVSLMPIGAMTQKMQGENLSEMYDMFQNKVASFTDYKQSIQNYNLIKVALQYVQDFGAVLQIFPMDYALKGKGFVNEGIESTQLGLKGSANIAEFSAVQKILELIEYTGGCVHFPTISTLESVSLIKDAKAKGLQVTCSVAVHQLLLTDELLQDFDTNYKVNPPLRTKKDQKALIDGVLDGTIDIICTDHNPINIEDKDLEFELAKDGTLGLESAFPALKTILPIETIVEKLTNAYQIFNYNVPKIALNEEVNCTIFKDSETYDFSLNHLLSTSKNSIFLNHKMQGLVVGCCNNGIIFTN